MQITTHYGAHIELNENHNIDQLWTTAGERRALRLEHYKSQQAFDEFDAEIDLLA